MSAVGANGCPYEIVTLTDELARLHAKRLVALHNLIPHVTWSEDQLLAQQDRQTHREYVGKWSMSLCAFHEDEPVALLVAYIRNDNVRNCRPGLYIHRLAVAVEHQRNRLGTQMTQAAVYSYFTAIPGLKEITVQTNDEFENQGVIAFYRSLGFKDYSKVAYRNKQDLLLHIQQRSGIGPSRRRRPQRPPGVEESLNKSAAFVAYLSALLASPALKPSSRPSPGWEPLQAPGADVRARKTSHPLLSPMHEFVRRLHPRFSRRR